MTSMKTATLIPVLLLLALLSTLVFALANDGFGIWFRTWALVLGGYCMGWFSRR